MSWEAILDMHLTQEPPDDFTPYCEAVWEESLTGDCMLEKAVSEDDFAQHEELFDSLCHALLVQGIDTDDARCIIAEFWKDYKWRTKHER